jgi:hypothetical protein
MSATYSETTINGYKVSIFKGYDGTQLFITDSTGIQIYAHRVSGDPMTRAKEVIREKTGEAIETAADRLEKAKAKTMEIFNSRHIKRVEVSLEESFDGVRVYSAITRESNVPHCYIVRVKDSFENGETITTGHCNCFAGAKGYNCRHLEAVAALDAKQLEREVYPFELAEYKAHKYRRQAA